MPTIFGIVNITRDSFSDGGRWLAADAAIAQAERLLADGADVIDLGAESTHPDAETVPADEEIRRLEPVVVHLKGRGAAVSIDTHKAPVMRRMLELGADYINDVTALRDDSAIAAIRDSRAKVVLMHSVGSSAVARAQKADSSPATLVQEICTFFEQRRARLEQSGIDRARLILDPGMGFFLGKGAEASLAVLRDLPRLKSLGLPLLVSVSRKSFIGELLGSPGRPRPVEQRGLGTVAAELWAAVQGAECVRTHEPAAFADVWRVWTALQLGDSKVRPDF